MKRDEFEQHPIWNTLEACELRVRDGEAWLAEGSAPNIAQLRWVLATVRSHDDPGDVAPYARTSMDALQGSLTQIQNSLDQVIAQKSGAYLNSAEPYIEQATVQVVALPSVSNREPARAASRTFSDYRDAVEESMDALRQRNDELTAKVEELHAAETAQQATHASEVASLTDQLTALETRITADEERLRKELTNTNEAFNAKQTERQERFAEWLDEQAAALDAKAITDLSKIGALKDDASKRLTEIKKLHDDVEKTSGKAASAILAKDYGAYSTREWVSGVVAYVLGFGLLVGLAGYLIGTVADVAKDEEVSWQYVALKLGLTLTAVAAAGVAFQFGSHALTRANTNKRVQLELGTIGTFLADVEDDDAVQKAKVDFVNRMFGRAWDEVPGKRESNNESGSVAKLVDTVQTLANR